MALEAGDLILAISPQPNVSAKVLMVHKCASVYLLVSDPAPGAVSNTMFMLYDRLRHKVIKDLTPTELEMYCMLYPWLECEMRDVHGDA